MPAMTRGVVWALLFAAGVAWGQPAPQGNPPSPSQPAAAFEQTKPPEWQAPQPPPSAPATEPSPEMAKIQQVQAEMDKPGATATTPGTSSAAGREPSMVNSTLRATVTLCIVLGIIFALAYLAKRLGKRSPLLAGAQLADVLGKVYLSPKVCLYFVRSAGRVMVVGVTQSAIAPIAEFDATSFDSAAQPVGAAPFGARSESAQADALLSQIKTSFQDILKAETSVGAEDEDVAALRKDIHRLQQYLEASARPRQQ